MIPRFMFVLAAAFAAGSTLAQPGSSQYVYAPVVEVEPLYVTERVPVEREICWEERGYPQQQRGDSATGTIAGAIIGGVIGNQFGGGSGRKALTVAGAALGASIGNNAARNQGRSRREGRPLRYERCEIQVDYEERSYTSGYRVRYEYNGEILETRMQNPPGDVIRLRVTAVPVG